MKKAGCDARTTGMTKAKAKCCVCLLCALYSSLFVAAQGASPTSATNATALFDGTFHASSTNGMEEAYLETLARSSHAANLLKLKNGDLLCFWFSGTHEGDSNVAIVISRLTKDSKQWSKTVEIDHQEGRSFQNPVAFQTPSGRIWLLHTSQPAGEWQTNAEVLYLTSDDDGQTWTIPHPLFTQPGSFTRHPPILISKKHWLLPIYYTPSRSITDGAESNYSAVKLTKDGGKSWQECKIPQSNGLVQETIARLANGHFLGLFRSRYADFIYKSTSDDGCDWTAPTPTHLPNNNSSIQLAKLRDGSLVLAFNNSSAGTTHEKTATSARKPLSIALSEDGGETWPWIRDIETGSSIAQQNVAHEGHKTHEEFSYPSLLQDAQGKINVAYSYNRETIKVVRFEKEWIKQGQTEGQFKGNSLK
jgi:predicted neuraminidase